MQREVQFARPDDTLADAQKRRTEQGIKALPVIDKNRQIVGIVTAADLRPDPDSAPSAMRESSAPVAARMTRQVRVVSETRHLSELIPLFASSGRHHLPVIDASARRVGMITQSDVMQALHRAPQATTAPLSACSESAHPRARRSSCRHGHRPCARSPPARQTVFRCCKARDWPPARRAPWG